MNALEARARLFDRIRSRFSNHAKNFWTVLRSCSPWMLLIPVAAAVTCLQWFFPEIWRYNSSQWFQRTSAWVLAVSFVATVTMWVLRGDDFHRWMIFVIACLLSRVLQMAGTEVWVTIGLGLLVWWASVNFEPLRPYLENRLLTSLLLGATLCMILPGLVPHAFWVAVAKYGFWQRRFAMVLPLVGHSTMLSAVACSEILWRSGRLSTETAVLLPFDRSLAADAIDEELRREAA